MPFYRRCITLDFYLAYCSGVDSGLSGGFVFYGLVAGSWFLGSGFLVCFVRVWSG